MRDDDGGVFGEWEEKKLGEIGKVSMCKRIMKDQTTINGEIPFYKIGTFAKKADAFISMALYESYKRKYSFPKKGDILISASGTIGRTVIYNGSPAYFQDSNIIWIDNNEKIIKNNFLFVCYKNINWNTENTTIARLYNNNVRNIKINLPPLKEQTKIANFLSSIDKKIELVTQQLDAVKAFKKALLQQMFV
ncbi:MAG: restriction endonuclease subunit S [Sulfurovum sp.]|nr:restriction endonuclease subunit S [Sulfurovum sp.]